MGEEMKMTLREICEAENVSRRAVQGYEKMGLVTATGKTDRGYLLYNEKAGKRIRKIKLYQDFGFSLKEIKEIIDAPGEVLKPVLQIRLEKLKEERDKKDDLVRKINELIESC